jgi:hypothetical protein
MTGTEVYAALVTPWALPGDAAAWLSALLGCVMLVPAVHAHFARLSARTFLVLSGAVALGVSAAYVTFYLKGGPKIIDATTYALQASSLARGAFSLAASDPSESFRGRFLYYNEAAHTLTGIFPPGYPLVLAIGVALGVPMLVGPVLAALLVWLTYGLAKDVTTAIAPAEPCCRSCLPRFATIRLTRCRMA